MSSMGYKGFTLIELIIVVSIVSTLLVLTLPSYQRQLINTRRSMGVAELLDVVIRQEQYFIDYKQYAETLSSLGFLTSPYAISPDGEAVSVLAESRVYLIDLTTSEYGYTLYAVPQLSQVEDRLCGTLSLNSLGIKSATGDGPTSLCW
ncbi:MAG: type IV pilin protein [Halioglobus sp.]|jgi:type IV pilus assembly protein PilE